MRAARWSSWICSSARRACPSKAAGCWRSGLGLGLWWEGPCGILWFPPLPAILGKFYVRLLRRDPAYLDTLQLVTAGRLRRWLRAHRSQLEILGWGEQLWEERVRRLGFAEYAALGRLKELLRIAHRLRLVNGLVRVGRSLHWETPIILTARKRGH